MKLVNRLDAAEVIFKAQNEANDKFNETISSLEADRSEFSYDFDNRLKEIKSDFVRRFTKAAEKSEHRFGLQASENYRNGAMLKVLAAYNAEIRDKLQFLERRTKRIEGEFGIRPPQDPDEVED